MILYSSNNYKTVIDAFLASKPRKGRGLLTQLAASADMTSAQLSHVLRGDRDLTFEQSLKVGKFLGFNELELQYFFEMINYARAGTTDLKNFAKRRMETLKIEGLKLKNQVPEHEDLSEASKAKFYSSWIYSAVRLFCSIEPKQIEQIMSEFHLDRGRANEILVFLCENRLCVQTDDGFVMGRQTTFIPRTSPFVHKHQTNWRIRALDRSESNDERDLFFTSPVSLSQKDFEKMNLKFTEVIKEFSSVVRDSPAEIVACLNIDLFTVTEV